MRMSQEKEGSNYGPHLIGHRIITEDGHVGTIKFVGSLANNTDTWFGVDWDDPKRGKHNGTFKGVNYFKTLFPTSGSFVRPNKVLFGTSLIKAMKQRYSCEESLIKDLDNPTVLLKRSHGDINIELVGIEKMSREMNDLKKIVSANLNGQPISHCEMEKEDAEQLVNLRELILSRTLLNSWLEVAKVCEALPRIQSLDVSRNKLTPIGLSDYDSAPRPDGDQSHPELKILQSALKNVVELCVNGVDYSWTEMLPVLNCFSQLETLRSIHNQLNQLPSSYSLSGLVSLTFLDLTSNQISNFGAVMWPLGEQLVHLKYLQLKDNEIPDIDFPGVLTELTTHFPSLTELCISNNQISSWSSIDQCNRLPSLTSLIILNNPVLTCDVPDFNTAFQVALAKLERVVKLNHVQINRAEKRGAEIDYLKRYGEAWFAAGGIQSPDGQITHASADFIEKHPRYEKLVARHGAPEKSEFTKISGRIREGLLQLHLTYPEKAAIQKSIPDSMMVLQLKRFIKRVFKLKHDDIYLVYTTAKSRTEFPMDKDTRDVSFFGLANGDTIHARPNL